MTFMRDSSTQYGIKSLDRNPDANDALTPDNECINTHFEQVLKRTGGDRDAAAMALNTISQAPGFKPDQHRRRAGQEWLYRLTGRRRSRFESSSAASQSG